MTVHKAKGLEFDTVLLPLTNRLFRKEITTELILDETQTPRRVGWSRVTIKPDTWNEVSSHLCNNYYQDCLLKEFDDVDREEARLLYVALTRAIRRLECFVIGNNPHSWANMLEV
jgi:DNA helicase-2/ATP-dependent DNA helicase PcrA